MSHLTNRLLALAKAEPRAIFTFAAVDLNLVASEAASELVTMALAKNLELEFEEAGKPALVRGDAANLKELTTNLIENAILYTGNGGTVTVNVLNSDGIKLIVEDTGSGIAPEERERVFERFYRVLGTQVDGSGLGLAIVKEIAEAHRAEVSVETGSSGKGTKFIVNFPASS